MSFGFIAGIEQMGWGRKTVVMQDRRVLRRRSECVYSQVRHPERGEAGLPSAGSFPLLPRRRLLLYRMETGKVTSDNRADGTVATSIDAFTWEMFRGILWLLAFPLRVDCSCR